MSAGSRTFVWVGLRVPASAGHYRAGRFFRGGETVRMEVVAGDVPQSPRGDDGNPSMTQISAAGLDLLRQDPGLVVADRAARAAEIATARAALAAESGRLDALQREIDAS